jgi:hypothetical protein
MDAFSLVLDTKCYWIPMNFVDRWYRHRGEFESDHYDTQTMQTAGASAILETSHVCKC